jgi:hypothetical protein
MRSVTVEIRIRDEIAKRWFARTGIRALQGIQTWIQGASDEITTRVEGKGHVSADAQKHVCEILLLDDLST